MRSYRRSFFLRRRIYNTTKTAQFRSSFRSTIHVFIVFAFFSSLLFCSVSPSYYYVQFRFIFYFYPFFCVYYYYFWLLFFDGLGVEQASNSRKSNDEICWNHSKCTKRSEKKKWRKKKQMQALDRSPTNFIWIKYIGFCVGRSLMDIRRKLRYLSFDFVECL